MKDDWLAMQRVWKVVSRDYELRALRDEFLFLTERECSEKTKNLSEWRGCIEKFEGETVP